MIKLKELLLENNQIDSDESNYLYHGTNDGAGYHIQRSGRMKLNAANNDEPFISFTSKMAVAKYYAHLKGGGSRGIILRTSKTNDFKLSNKFRKNNGYEWVTTKEIPVNQLEIQTDVGWVPLKKWDFIDKKLISEVVRLQSINLINNTIKKELADVAQKVYDDWIQDEHGMNDEFGTGGICHLIADDLIDVLNKHNIWDCQTVCSTHEQHVYIVGRFREGIFMIDIPYSYYETGGGFTWKKRPNVIFDGSYIVIDRLDVNPRKLNQYTDQM